MILGGPESGGSSPLASPKRLVSDAQAVALEVP